MGMYTELVLGVNLRHDTPPEVIEILRYMLAPVTTAQPSNLPDHPLFKEHRWSMVLAGSSSSFPGGTHSRLHRIPDDDYELSVRANVKNYGSVIQHFISWIRPYISSPEVGGFMGYMRHEEAEHPRLLYVPVEGMPINEAIARGLLGHVQVTEIPLRLSESSGQSLRLGEPSRQSLALQSLTPPAPLIAIDFTPQATLPIHPKK